MRSKHWFPSLIYPISCCQLHLPETPFLPWYVIHLQKKHQSLLTLKFITSLKFISSFSILLTPLNKHCPLDKFPFLSVSWDKVLYFPLWLVAFLEILTVANIYWALCPKLYSECFICYCVYVSLQHCDLGFMGIAGRFFPFRATREAPYGYCCSSVVKSCLTLCDPMDCSILSFPVHHYLLEPTYGY